jgi:ectoine hydroxylase-related dioxygenase (phytanoyl-CoA dioxygenase family)
MNSGYGLFHNGIDLSEIEKLKSLMDKIAVNLYSEYENKLISNEEFAIKSLQEKIIFLSTHASELTTKLINSTMYTTEFYDFCINSQILEKCKPLLSTKKSEPVTVTLSSPNLRVDLPSKFSNEESKYTLGWHQESAYFTKGVSHTAGLVIWVPLFSVNEVNGSVELIPDSHINGSVPHTSCYMDKENNRNLRKTAEFTVDTKNTGSCILTMEPGGFAIFDFNLIHRSSPNNSELPRLTIQFRTSNVLDKGLGYT